MTTKTLTNNFGAPVPDNQHSLTAGERGPVLPQDHFLLEKLAHFDRERIPERVVHAKGAGAFGYFEASADMSTSTRARLVDNIAGHLGHPDRAIQVRQVEHFRRAHGEYGQRVAEALGLTP